MVYFFEIPIMLRTLLLSVTKKTSLCIFAMLAALSLRPAAAQNTPSVTATISGYTATGQGATIPESEWVPITVTRNDSALHAETSGDGGSYFTSCTTPCLYPPEFTSTSAGGFASADPGVLRVYARNLVMALPMMSAPNLPPGDPNTNTVYASISAGAGFTDYLTVSVAGQPIGTPVQVPFRYAADVISDTILGYPEYSFHPLAVTVSFRFTGFGDQNFTTENRFGFTVTTLPNGNFLHSLRSDEFFVNAKVGDVLTISASMGIGGTPRITNGNNGNGRGNVIGAWADGRNTAGIWLGNLPSGMVITSASGHDYRIDPTMSVPVAPVQVTPTATAGDSRAVVSFTAPIGTGASAVTEYIATSLPGDIVAKSTRSPIVVLGLTNGTAYTFTVTSKNAKGASATSVASNSITPSESVAPAVASAPVIGLAAAGDARVTVNFTAPTTDGGSSITSYTVTSFPSGITASGTTSPITIAGLVNDVAYTFTVTARNAIGVSAPSAASNSVTPTAATPTPTPTPLPTPTETDGSGGGSVSLTLLVAMASIYWLRRNNTQRWKYSNSKRRA